jgi:hypothetical protein
MAKRNLRIVTEGSPLIGICETCNTQFRSYSPVKEARQTIQSQFDAHQCKRLDDSQNAARIVKEATTED